MNCGTIIKRVIWKFEMRNTYRWDKSEKQKQIIAKLDEFKLAFNIKIYQRLHKFPADLLISFYSSQIFNEKLIILPFFDHWHACNQPIYIHMRHLHINHPIWKFHQNFRTKTPYFHHNIVFHPFFRQPPTQIFLIRSRARTTFGIIAKNCRSESSFGPVSSKVGLFRVRGRHCANPCHAI